MADREPNPVSLAEYQAIKAEQVARINTPARACPAGSREAAALGIVLAAVVRVPEAVA